MSRTDLHSPKNFDPVQYRYVGSFYQGTCEAVHEMDLNDEDAIKLLAINERNAFRFEGNFAKYNSCDHCGSRFAYGSVFQHKNGDVVVVGQHCARNAFGSETKMEASLKRIAGAVALAREATKLGRKIAALFAANPGLEEALCVRHRIINDMNSKLVKWGELSEKQIAFCIKLADEITIREATEPKIVITEGRRDLVVTILSCKHYYSDEFGDSYKMFVKTDAGEKLWGSVPKGLLETTRVDHGVNDNPPRPRLGCVQHEKLKGLRVEIRATVKGSDKDIYFGIWSRPMFIKVLGRVETDTSKNDVFDGATTPPES